MTIRQTIRGGIHRILQHTWLVFVPAVLCFAAAAIYATGADDEYEASAVLSIRSVKPSDSLMRSAVVASARDMVKSLRERMLSYDSLVRIVQELDPFPELNDMERSVEQLGRRIQVRINSKSNTIGVKLTMSEGSDPAQMAEDVIAMLIELYRKDQAQATTTEGQDVEDFLDESQRDYTRKLEQLSAALDAFRIANRGALPEDEALNREMIRAAERRIADAQATRDRNRAVRDNIQLELVRVQEDLRRVKEDFEGDVEVSKMRDYLLGLRRSLIAAKQVHTDDSPVIKELEDQIKRTEAALEELKASKLDSMDGQSGVLRLYKSMIESRQRGLKILEEQDSRADDQVKEAREEISAANERIMQGKKIAATYSNMMREVADAKASRDRINEKLEEARFQMKFQKKENATPIEVIGDPRAGGLPVGPKRLEMSLMGLAFGLALGVGLALVKEKLNSSIRQSSDLRMLLPGAVVVTLPDIQATGVRISRALGAGLLAAVLLAIFTAAAGILGIRMGWWGQMSTIEPLLPWIPKL